MKFTGTQLIVGVIAITALMAATAFGTSYMLRDEEATKPARVQQTRTYTETRPVNMASTQQLPPCDDNNIVGTLAGGVAGGVVGNQFGSGSGRTIATVGGAAAGAYLGNQYIPTRGATCR